MDSENYGTPQTRRRYILVAVLKPVRKLLWPAFRPWNCCKGVPLEPLRASDVPKGLPAKRFSLSAKAKNRQRWLVKEAIRKIRAAGLSPKHALVDVGASKSRATYGNGVWPTLTRTRCMQRGYWVLSRGRYATLKELVRGMGLRRIAGLSNKYGVPAAKVSRTQIGKMLGNSVPFQLACAVLAAAIQCSGLVGREDVAW